jgi:hypothetical protein
VFIGDRYFNAYALGFADWFTCPDCNRPIGSDDDIFADQMSNLGMAATAWCAGEDDASAQCLSCQATPNVTDWTTSAPVFLADMAVEFWNWPYLDPDAEARRQWWHLDVVAILEQSVGTTAMLSGHKI